MKKPIVILPYLLLLSAGCADPIDAKNSVEYSSRVTLSEDDFGLIEVLEYDDSEKLETLKINNEQYEFIIKMNYNRGMELRFIIIKGLHR